MGKLFHKETSGAENGAFREGVTYLIFGGLTTLIDYVISVILFYRVGLSSVVSQTISWVVAVLFAFVTNKWWVFNSHTMVPREVWREFVSFVICRIATFLFNLAAIYVMVDWMKIDFFISKLVISVVVIVLNYVFSKVLIFARKSDGE